MIIACDVDEVLADLLNTVIDYHNDTFGTSLKRERFRSYEWWEIWGGTREEAIDKYYAFWRSGYSKRIRPIRGSIEGVNALRQKHDLVVITSRQLDFEEQTREWIQKYFPNVFSQIYLTNSYSRSGEPKSKSEICLQSGVELLIDDQWFHAVICSEVGIRALLFDAPWNRNRRTLPKNVTRVKSWDEIIEILTKN